MTLIKIFLILSQKYSGFICIPALWKSWLVWFFPTGAVLHISLIIKAEIPDGAFMT